MPCPDARSWDRVLFGQKKYGLATAQHSLSEKESMSGAQCGARTTSSPLLCNSSTRSLNVQLRIVNGECAIRRRHRALCTSRSPCSPYNCSTLWSVLAPDSYKQDICTPMLTVHINTHSKIQFFVYQHMLYLRVLLNETCSRSPVDKN
jgi:hypothetical protein